MPGALDGIRIIDFGQYIPGPLAAMMLGDQGAEVIRVDPPAARSGGRRPTPPGSAASAASSLTSSKSPTARPRDASSAAPTS